MKVDNSSYVKMVLKNNKEIALAVDKGVDAFIRGFKKSLNQISMGAEQLTWYSACYFSRYQSECKELSKEDIRVTVCLYEFFTRKDPVADLILICVKYIFNFYDKKERIRILAMVYDVYENYNSPPGVPFGYGKDDYDIKDCEDFLAIQADSPESRLLLEKIAHACEFSLWDIAREPFMDTNSIINPAKITTDLVVRKTVAYAFSKAAAESMTLTLVLRKKIKQKRSQSSSCILLLWFSTGSRNGSQKTKNAKPRLLSYSLQQQTGNFFLPDRILSAARNISPFAFSE